MSDRVLSSYFKSYNSYESKARRGDINVGDDYINRNLNKVKYDPEYSTLNKNLINSNSKYSSELQSANDNYSNRPSAIVSSYYDDPHKYSDPFWDCKTEEETLYKRASVYGDITVGDKFIEKHKKQMWNNGSFYLLHQNLLERNLKYKLEYEEWKRGDSGDSDTNPIEKEEKGKYSKMNPLLIPFVNPVPQVDKRAELKEMLIHFTKPR